MNVDTNGIKKNLPGLCFTYLTKLNNMMNGSSYSSKYKLAKKYTWDYSSEQCKGPNNDLLNINTSKRKKVGSVTNMFLEANLDGKNTISKIVYLYP